MISQIHLAKINLLSSSLKLAETNKDNEDSFLKREDNIHYCICWIILFELIHFNTPFSDIFFATEIHSGIKKHRYSMSWGHQKVSIWEGNSMPITHFPISYWEIEFDILGAVDWVIKRRRNRERSLIAGCAFSGPEAFVGPDGPHGIKNSKEAHAYTVQGNL